MAAAAVAVVAIWSSSWLVVRALPAGGTASVAPASVGSVDLDSRPGGEPNGGSGRRLTAAPSLGARMARRPDREEDLEQENRPAPVHQDPVPVHEDGEGAHAARFTALWEEGGETRRRLERDAPRILLEASSTAEQVALLRALGGVESPVSDDLVDLALRELPDEPDGGGLSVPAFVVSHVARAGKLRPRERECLERAVRRGDDHLAANTRGRALCTLVETATDADLPSLALLIDHQSDGLVRAMGRQALRQRGEEGCRRR